jgi:NCAIR mutase (PurE)-related protein
MQEPQLRQLLEAIRDGSTDIDSALQRLKSLPFEDVEHFARLDNHRELRTGFPEVVFGQGKTPEQVIKIAQRLAERNNRVLVTRVSPEMYAAVQAELPEMTYHAAARLLVLDRSDPAEREPGVVVATGGTADIPVAEARSTGSTMWV